MKKVCLLLILFLIIPTFILAEPIRQEIFGFRFGMTYEEARKNALSKGYKIYKGYPVERDPYYHNFNEWNFGLPLPSRFEMDVQEKMVMI